VSEDSPEEDSDFFIGGVILPWGTSVGRPAILMTITEERIVFRHRYFGSFFGPWVVERERIVNVYPERRVLLNVLSKGQNYREGRHCLGVLDKTPQRCRRNPPSVGVPSDDRRRDISLDSRARIDK
jgi:hypothetical protein